MRHEFDIAAFDPHPAFRIKRTRSGKRPIRLTPRRSANVRPLPTIAGTPPIARPKHDGVSFDYTADLGLPLSAFVPVFAVSDGAIVYAGEALGVHAVTLDHGDRYRSFYSGLVHCFVMPTSRHVREQRVKAGDVLGYVNPSTPHSAALHFALMRHDDDGRFQIVDPLEAMRTWCVIPWTGDRTTPPTTQAIAA